MTMDDLAECQAEIIQPIKYEYKAKEGQDGVSLWEVSAAWTRKNRVLITVSTEWPGSHCIGSVGYHRSFRSGEGNRRAGTGT
jgi:hypothetical protein